MPSTPPNDNPPVAPAPPGPPPAAEVATTEKSSYGQILKSTGLIGGSSVLSIAIRIVQTKAMAVMLGPAGVGLLGVYGSIADLALSIAGMGVNSSGVRQIAEAVGSGEQERIARTAAVLRRTALFLGVLVAVSLVACSGFVSTLTFGDDQYATAVALLSLAVFFNLVSGGQGALIQGMRRIADLAKFGVLGTLFGMFISIPIVYFLREEGVAPALVGIAAMTLVTSWWYRRKIPLKTPSMTASQMGQEQAALLKLGFAFMASGLMMMGAAYAVRVMVLQKVGLEAAGWYQAAWALGGLYVGLVLQAMGADFYPRLTAIAKNNPECNRVVNEQAQVSLLLAGPGVIATLTFAPLIIAIFYSSKFTGAVELLRWLCLGIALRVISWPMGFIIIAKGKQTLFFFSDLAWTVVYLSLVWIFMSSSGLNGAGIAFFGVYIFHCFLIYLIVRRLSGFLWSAANRKVGLLFLSLITLVFYSFYVLPPLLAAGVGTLAVIFSSVYSIQTLLKLVSQDQIPRPIRWLLLRLSCARSSSI